MSDRLTRRARRGKEKDRKDPTKKERNYRPITLLNTDYKIFTRILAIRMQKKWYTNLRQQFVSESQKGFVPDVFNFS